MIAGLTQSDRCNWSRTRQPDTSQEAQGNGSRHASRTKWPSSLRSPSQAASDSTSTNNRRSSTHSLPEQYFSPQLMKNLSSRDLEQTMDYKPSPSLQPLSGTHSRPRHSRTDPVTQFKGKLKPNYITLCM